VILQVNQPEDNSQLSVKLPMCDSSLVNDLWMFCGTAGGAIYRYRRGTVIVPCQTMFTSVSVVHADNTFLQDEQHYSYGTVVCSLYEVNAKWGGHFSLSACHITLITQWASNEGRPAPKVVRRTSVWFASARCNCFKFRSDV